MNINLIIKKKWEEFRRSRPRLFRNLGLLFAFIVAAVLVVVPAFSQQPVVLTFLMNAPEVEPFRPLIKEFEAKNPDIRLNMIEGPNASNLIEDLNTSAFLLGSAPYDVINLDVTWVPKFAAAGWLTDLSDRFSKQELAQFLPADINGGRYQDKLYRIPWRTDAGMLYYRTDLVSQAGAQPPETFADLVNISKTLQQQKAAQWGYVWQGRQYEGVVAMFIEVLEGKGGFWVNPKTEEVGLDKPQAIDALKFLINTVRDGVSPPGVSTYQEDEARRLFQAGNTIFMRNWPYAWALLNAEDSPVKGKVGIKPMVHAPGHDSAACLGGWGWGIASTTKHPEEAWRMVKFFTSAEAQKKLILNTGYLPSRRALYSDPQLLEKYAFFPQVLQVLENAALRPPIAQYAQASDILQRYLSGAITGRMNPEDALRSAANETRVLLAGA
jgi:multiple sugar transport system substrate-binding protein